MASKVEKIQNASQLTCSEINPEKLANIPLGISENPARSAY